MTNGIQVSRRGMLQGMGGLVLAFTLPIANARAQSGAANVFRPMGTATGVLAPNAFLRVAPDDTVTILVKHIELGQGPLTGLSTLVAEEMDADWSQVRAELAPSNPELYKNLMFGIQGTGGSTAIANSYEQMRKAGAVARAMLVAAAAQTWSVQSSEITVEKGVLRHAKSNREGRFGEFAQTADRLPIPDDAPLKDPANFRLIGSDDGTVKRVDSAAKSTGKQVFTIDVREPDMLTVVVQRPPRFGGRVASVDAAAARAVPGVVDVKTIPGGVAVYANGTWPAIKGRKALRVQWDESRAEKRGSEQLIAEYRALAQKPGAVAGSHGDTQAAFNNADRVIEAEFVFPYLAHAPMEPLDGFIHWDGQQARARFASQLTTVDHQTIARVLGVPMERVALQPLLGGGSFGRRSQQTAHLADELAQAAKAMGPGRPLKLVWTREDDIRGGYYRPLTLHRMRGAIRDGRIAAWSDTIVNQSILKGSPMENMLKNGIDPTSVEGAQSLPYDIPDFRCDLHTTDVGVPVLWWRSVGHSHTGYAVECFIDELLQETGQDPVAGRLALMEKAPRHAGVLRAVADLARWVSPEPVNGRARGVAVVESFHSYIAQIAEVSLTDAGPRVHNVWCAVDCGVAVNPDVIRAQMEGGIGYGLGHALFAEVTLDEGRPVPGNFDAYRSLRIHEMPLVEVAIVRSTEKPTGVGEPGVPPIGPAIANALARLGVERPRRLPVVRETV
ncbi:MAG TPA: xanthine dehydrogenase family protein molybdopterin-binding subunit [Alphaproteobacteria bacterium]|nr:xanthine dehydrogenase family protein molybdopterin-binding subunit [Alphaproteobacteria bacterium]